MKHKNTKTQKHKNTKTQKCFPVLRRSRVFSCFRENGFTLVETIIYVAIIGIVLTAFISFSISITNSRAKVYSQQEVQANARIALNLITQKIMAANGVNVGTSAFGADPGVLSLSMADESKNPTIINLTADDGVLQITEGTSEPINITSNKVKITNLVFTNLTSTGDKENIKIELTAEYANTESAFYGYRYDLETAVSLRQ